MSKTKNNSVQGYKKSDIVVIAVFQLGGMLHHIHLEDVAIKAAELAPRAFCWGKYPERVNLESVRLALKSELAAKNTRVAGSIRDGWMLRPHGVSWCINLETYKTYEATMAPVKRELSQAQATPAFKKTLNGKVADVSDMDVKSLMRVNEYFSTRDVRERVLALANIALFEPKLQKVLDCLIAKGFKELEVSCE